MYFPNLIKPTPSGFCHTTKKSEAIGQRKEMPVISVNKVVDETIIIGKRRAEEKERHGR
jgi:hypothetical protein